MPAATAAAFAGIHNENEFYSHHYLSEIFSGDIRATVDRWREQADAESGRTPYAALRALAGDYVPFGRDFDRERRTAPRLTLQREWFRQLLPALGYAWAPTDHPLDDGDAVPALCAASGRAGTPALLALGAYDDGRSLLDSLDENSHKHAFALSELCAVDAFRIDAWTRPDPRMPDDWDTLPPTWNRDVALRTDFARR